MQSKDFFTPKEAAEYLGLSVRTFYAKYVRKSPKGGPPIRRLGRNIIRIPKNKFVTWANDGTGG